MPKGNLGKKPATLGDLRRSRWSEERIASRSVRDEMRENLLHMLERREALFPGIIGYEDTVVPQLVNAILSRHHMVLLGLRGQAKSRILRSLVDLLDDDVPMIAGCEINDNPYAPLCRACRDRGNWVMVRPSPGCPGISATWRNWRRPTSPSRT